METTKLLYVTMKKWKRYRVFVLVLFVSASMLFYTELFGQQNINQFKAEMDQIALTDTKKAIAFGKRFLATNTTFKDEIHYKIGLLDIQCHNYKDAAIHFGAAHLIYKKKGLEKQAALSLLGLSETNAYLNKKDESMLQTMDALAISKRIKDKSVEAKAYGNLGLIYYKLDDYRKAMAFTVKASEIQELRNDSAEMAMSYNNIAVFYKHLGLLDSATVYMQSALKIYQSIGDLLPVAICYSNLGSMLYKQRKVLLAIEYYKKSLAIHRKLKTNNPIPFLNLARLYHDLDEYEKAMEYFKQALHLAKASHSLVSEEAAYSELFKLSMSQKDYKNAIGYQQKIDSISDLRQKAENMEKLALVDSEYLLKEQDALLSKKLEINRRNKVFFGGLSLVLLLFGLYLIQRNRNAKLQNQQEKLILEQRVLSSQMNPHFVYNTLSAIQSSLLKNDPLTSADSLSRFAKLIRQNFEFVNKERITLEDDLDALKNYIDTQRFRFNNQFDYEINISEKIDTQMIEIPPLLLQPFVENAIEHGLKHKKAKGLLVINIFKKNEKVCIMIKDNGIGLQKNLKKDGKLHSLDIFKQRIGLLHKDDVESFSLSDATGETVVKFCLTI